MLQRHVGAAQPSERIRCEPLTLESSTGAGKGGGRVACPCKSARHVVQRDELLGPAAKLVKEGGCKLRCHCGVHVEPVHFAEGIVWLGAGGEQLKVAQQHTLLVASKAAQQSVKVQLRLLGRAQAHFATVTSTCICRWPIFDGPIRANSAAEMRLLSLRLLSLLMLVCSVVGYDEEAVEQARSEAQELRRDGQQPKAQARLREALSSLTAAQGAGSPPTAGHAKLLSDLAAVCTDQGLESEAIAAGEEAVDIYTKLHSPKDGRRLMEMGRLAKVHSAFKRHHAAAELLEEQLEVMRTIGTMPPEAFQQTLSQRGDALTRAGDHHEAAGVYKELVAMLAPLVTAAVEGGEEAAEGEKEEAEAAEEAARDRLADAQMQAAKALALSSTPIGYSMHTERYTKSGKKKSAAKIAKAERQTQRRRERSTSALNEALQLATAARDLYLAMPSRKGTMSHAFAVNGIAGILERLHRHEESIKAMEESIEIAQGAPDGTPELVEVGERTLDGLREKIEKKENKINSMSNAPGMVDIKKQMHLEL